MFSSLGKNIFRSGAIRPTHFLMNRSMVERHFIPRYPEYNRPIVIEFTPVQIKMEYLADCCESGCEQCPMSPNYNEKSMSCCGRDCVYCPYVGGVSKEAIVSNKRK